MLKMVLIVALLASIGCDEEKMSCTSTVDCTDDKEMVCDLPVTHEYPNGEVIEVRACTYVTYENCLEQTICKPKDNK